jgi:adenosine deaminase
MNSSDAMNEQSLAFARAMPKISLHLHLTGAVEASTVADLASKYDEALPGGRTAERLYEVAAYADLGYFLQVYDFVGSVIREPADFHRVTYESLAAGARHGVVYREMFVSPASHAGVTYRTLLEGVLAGIRDAEADFGIVCRIIPAINREHSASEAVELVETVISERRDEVIGIGMDYEERLGPPERFWRAYQIAGAAGLQRTVHSETGPPSNIETALDLLGCTRIDHGYHVTTSPAVTQRCLDEGIVFTCTPVTSDIGGYSGSGDGTHRTIKAMVDAGIAVTIDSDDPPMFGTDPSNDYEALVSALGYDHLQLSRFTRAGVAAAWLDETDRAGLSARVEAALASAAGAGLTPTS